MKRAADESPRTCKICVSHHTEHCAMLSSRNCLYVEELERDRSQARAALAERNKLHALTLENEVLWMRKWQAADADFAASQKTVKNMEAALARTSKEKDEQLSRAGQAEDRAATLTAVLDGIHPILANSMFAGYRELAAVIRAAIAGERPKWEDTEVALKIAQATAAKLVELNNKHYREACACEVRCASLVTVLEYWRDECSGAEPSLSVFGRMVDAALKEQP